MLNRYTSVFAIIIALFVSSTSYASMVDVASDHQTAHKNIYKPYEVIVFAGSQMIQERPMHQKQDFDSVSRETEITTVPVPAAAWLFLSGLMGLLTVSRRKKEHAKG